MTQHPYYRRVWVLKRYLHGPLTSHLDPFSAFLEKNGFAYQSGQRYVREVGRLSKWAADRQIKVEDVNESIVKEYLKFRFKNVLKVRRGPFNRFLEYLQDAGISQSQSPRKSPLNQCLQHYKDHLIQNQGLQIGTIRRLVRVARSFLSTRFSNGTVDLSKLRCQDIVQYLLKRSRQCSPSSLGIEASALRSFLRFLWFRGTISPRLAQSVPIVPGWRQKGLPVFLNPEEISQLFHHVNRQTPKGQRDFAILLLLARLGLRGVEVCRLTLDDIDWHSGCIIVQGKNGKCNRLPLLDDVGQAIATYLRCSRPRCSTRHVFVRLVAPFKAFSSSSSVSSVVRSYLAKASLNPSRKGSHLLRHTFATQMLRQGASLMDIGQILRHQSINTTAIYAKVAMTQLRPIAREWPKGGIR